MWSTSSFIHSGEIRRVTRRAGRWTGPKYLEREMLTLVAKGAKQALHRHLAHACGAHDDDSGTSPSTDDK